MAKLGEPAIYRPGVCYVVCLRCKMSVGVEDTGSSLRLTYDVERWGQAGCCCRTWMDP
jgi:hypothetical protein